MFTCFFERYVSFQSWNLCLSVLECSEIMFLGWFVLWRFVCWGETEKSVIQVAFSYFAYQLFAKG